MILNSGLDNACTDAAANLVSGAIRYPYFGKFVRYAAFGTGSAAPAAGDTALGSQVGSRTYDRGGFADSEDAGLDAGANTIWYEGTFTRVFAIDSNVNATEWGLAPQATGNLSVRELFRADPNDNGSSPITLTLESGDQLQLVVTLRVEAEWEFVNKSFVITGTAGNDTNGKHDGKGTISSGASSITSAVAQSLGAAWPGGGVTSTYDRVYAWLVDISGFGKSGNLTGSNTYADGAAETYTPGDYYRDWVGTFSTSQANGDIYGFQVGFNHSGYRFYLTDPVKLTKAATHRLILTFRRSISRL